MFSKSRTYYFDSESIKEPSADPAGKTERRNKRDVWRVNIHPYSKAHFATYPPELIRPCILAGCPKGGTVLDPFIGSGTTAYVAKQEGRDYIGIEIQPEYEELIYGRIAET